MALVWQTYPSITPKGGVKRGADNKDLKGEKKNKIPRGVILAELS